MIEADLVDKFAGLLTVLGNVRQWQSIGFQCAEAGYRRIQFYVLAYRVFVVGASIQTLRFFGSQVFQQFDCVVLVG
ncbi:hypothetical protein D3C78_1862110 [compost metagenome]